MILFFAFGSTEEEKKRKQNVGREEMKVYKRTDSFAEQSKKK